MPRRGEGPRNRPLRRAVKAPSKCRARRRRLGACAQVEGPGLPCSARRWLGWLSQSRRARARERWTLFSAMQRAGSRRPPSVRDTPLGLSARTASALKPPALHIPHQYISTIALRAHHSIRDDDVGSNTESGRRCRLCPPSLARWRALSPRGAHNCSPITDGRAPRPCSLR